MKRRQTIYYFGNQVDYKYKQITSRMPIDYIPTNFLGIARSIIGNRLPPDNVLVHIRYLFWRGYLTTAFLYLALISICKIKDVKIVWSCHNIYEHVFPSKIYNSFLRSIMARASNKILVFHPTLTKHFSSTSEKVVVVNFGGFRDHILDESHPSSPEFSDVYSAWLERIGQKSADIVFIGEYKARKNIEMLVEFARDHREVNVLIIAHNLSLASSFPNNLLVYHKSKVFRELDMVLKGAGVVGYVGHDNYSVPTGIHLYADYGVPILGIDVEPVSCLISQYNCGERFYDVDSLNIAYQKVASDYTSYSAGILRLSDENTWEKSAKSHCQAFGVSDKEC